MLRNKLPRTRSRFSIAVANMCSFCVISWEEEEDVAEWRADAFAEFVGAVWALLLPPRGYIRRFSAEDCVVE
jgi:hypothetical protein